VTRQLNHVHQLKNRKVGPHFEVTIIQNIWKEKKSVEQAKSFQNLRNIECTLDLRC
jgi:hypothetical protein